jgi:hypothetical protein
MSPENNIPAVTESAPPEAVAVSFDRLPGETPKAFAAFLVYRNMGADRSIVKAGRKLGKNRVTLEDWSVKYCWTERAAAYDAEQARKEQAAIDKAQAAEAAKWARRQSKHREDSFQLGQLMIRKARTILNGKKRFDPSQAHRLAAEGDKLVRLSADLPTGRTTIAGADNESPAFITTAGTVNVYLPEKEPLPDDPPKT